MPKGLPGYMACEVSNRPSRRVLRSIFVVALVIAVHFPCTLILLVLDRVVPTCVSELWRGKTFICYYLLAQEPHLHTCYT